ncbi:sensor histidine kinase [Fluviispira multicolorata]|uniref:histidine kinase n=1 Tax=Fluviispira multicolorata TaxID=2654512 RepID=A0A833JHT6_9BACT|nr:HAMP domain-containing sensor histidine kinase [Fluviispira multicolorata]KAB8033703.1 hypothetical protein GCL57_03075 [Fluviispira multicolorata]
MRAIYNLTTLKFACSAPLIRKILGTFLVFWIVFFILASLFFLGFLQKHFSQEIALFILKKIFIIWIFISIALIFLLWILLKNSISPLVFLITHFKNSTTLQEIEIPKNLSKEIYELYEILNTSINRINEFQRKSHEKNAAIAMTTKLLAHDVRQPFALLRAGLMLLEKTKDSEQMNSLLEMMIPEVNKSIQKVNGMLLDIMEIGANAENLILENINPESLIETIVTETFTIHSKSDISMEYHFDHNHMIKVHVLKIERVFSNILLNALQAMKFKGSIWFKTREVFTDEILYIEFCIGNSNSFISEENIESLFKAFYTRDKKNGIGLGLAIAEKVIQNHTGKIYCHSVKNSQFPEGKVEFYFTLPASVEILNKISTNLTSHDKVVSENKFSRNLVNK